jgi:hypothetical protein
MIGAGDVGHTTLGGAAVEQGGTVGAPAGDDRVDVHRADRHRGPDRARNHSAMRLFSSRVTSRTARSSGRAATVSGSRSISRRSYSGVGSSGSDARPSRRR